MMMMMMMMLMMNNSGKIMVDILCMRLEAMWESRNSLTVL